MIMDMSDLDPLEHHADFWGNPSHAPIHGAAFVIWAVLMIRTFAGKADTTSRAALSFRALIIGGAVTLAFNTSSVNTLSGTCVRTFDHCGIGRSSIGETDIGDTCIGERATSIVIKRCWRAVTQPKATPDADLNSTQHGDSPWC